MRITTCETRTQLIVYSVSLLAVSIFCDAFVAFVLFLFPSHYCFFGLFSAGCARGEIDDANATPLLPSWVNCLNGTALDAFHDQI